MMDILKERPETAAQILEAAKKEFAEKGYEGARISAIAKRARVNQALIHYYFTSKELLYQRLIKILLQVDRPAMIGDFPESMNLSPSQRLYLLIFMMVRLHQTNIDPDTNRIIAREIAEDRQWIRDLIREFFIPRMTIIEDIIKDGITTGEFETTSTLLAVMNVVIMIISYNSNRDLYRGTTIYQRLYENTSQEDFCNYIITMTFKSLTPSGRQVIIPTLSPEMMEMARQAVAGAVERKNGIE